MQKVVRVTRGKALAGVGVHGQVDVVFSLGLLDPVHDDDVEDGSVGDMP